MFKDFINQRVTLIISSRGDNLLEYVGTLIAEDENSVLLSNVDINYAMLNYQKSIFGGNIFQYKENLSKVVINKKYIISCE